MGRKGCARQLAVGRDDFYGALQGQALAAPLAQPEDVIKTIKEFPEGSAGGRSGLRLEHLKDVMVPGHGDELARNLAEVVALLASGKAHDSARQWICCASLVRSP